MHVDVENLPSDIHSLQKIIVDLHDSLQKVIQEKDRELEQVQQSKDREIEKLRHQWQLAMLKRFGSSSEKLSPNQMRLFDEAQAISSEEYGAIESVEERITIPEHSRRKRHPRALPKELPREQIIHDVPETEKRCACGQALHKMGEERTEKFDIIPAQLKVIEHIRYKYACRRCEGGVKTAALPAQAIPKSIATAGLLAYVLVSKFCDHLPLYRQEKIFQRMGIDLPDQTLSSWVIRSAAVLKPLVEALRAAIRTSDYVQADESPVQVLKHPNKENASRGYMWVYRAAPDGRVALVYDYHDNRCGENAEQFLQGFHGKLQTDAFSGYHGFDTTPGIVTAACWAHVRRKYMEIVKTTKTKGRAHYAVSQIQKLYAIEKEARELNYPFDQRQRLRQTQAKPILDAFKEWLDRSIEQVPPKSPIGSAIAYNHKLWPKLMRYVDYGDLEIDTNFVENAIRPFAIGRRNWLFCGNHRGAEAAAIIYSLVMTCKANRIEPYAYLKYVLDRLPSYRSDQGLKKFLPQYVDRDELNKAYRQHSWHSSFLKNDRS